MPCQTDSICAWLPLLRVISVDASKMHPLQVHEDRGIAFEVVYQGITRAMVDAKGKLGISSRLILNFTRHLGVEKSWACYKKARPSLSLRSAAC